MSSSTGTQDAVVVFQGITFPNGEVVADYAAELSEQALDILEFMGYPQEEYAFKRYLNMYEEYFFLKTKKTFTAQNFATKRAVRAFVRNYEESFHDEVEDDEDEYEYEHEDEDDDRYTDEDEDEEPGEDEDEDEQRVEKGKGKAKANAKGGASANTKRSGKEVVEKGKRKVFTKYRLSEKVAREIMEFLFVYYLSYYEGQAKYGTSSNRNKFKIKSFYAWFQKKRKEFAKKNKKLVEAQSELVIGTSPEALLLIAQLKEGKKKWKALFKNKYSYAGHQDHFNQANKIVKMSENELEALDWREIFQFGPGENPTVNNVSRKLRFLSRFLHPDKSSLFGVQFNDYLRARMVILSSKRDDAVDEIISSNMVEIDD